MFKLRSKFGGVLVQVSDESMARNRYPFLEFLTEDDRQRAEKLREDYARQLEKERRALYEESKKQSEPYNKLLWKNIL